MSLWGHSATRDPIISVSFTVHHIADMAAIKIEHRDNDRVCTACWDPLRGHLSHSCGVEGPPGGQATSLNLDGEWEVACFRPEEGAEEGTPRGADGCWGRSPRVPRACLFVVTNSANEWLV